MRIWLRMCDARASPSIQIVRYWKADATTFNIYCNHILHRYSFSLENMWLQHSMSALNDLLSACGCFNRYYFRCGKHRMIFTLYKRIYDWHTASCIQNSLLLMIEMAFLIQLCSKNANWIPNSWKIALEIMPIQKLHIKKEFLCFCFEK